MKQLTLTEGRVAPTLVRFALPFMLSSLLQSLYGAADLFVVGQYAGAAAVSGVSIGSSNSSNTLAAQAIAFCTSVTTPEISLNGFVYWLA